MARYDQCDATCTADCGHCKGQTRAAADQPQDLMANLKASIQRATERDWYFTFGHGQRGIAVTSFRTDPAEPQPGGFRLDDRYVRIHGTYMAARQRMVDMFGLVWCAQYRSADHAGVDQFGLTELVITPDPDWGATDADA